MFDSAIIKVDGAYSYSEAIATSVATESALGHLDVGPTDTLDPETLQLEQDLYFGTSPLSTPPTSPSRTRSASPANRSIPPPAESRHQSTNDPPPSKLNSKGRKNRKKDHAKRCKKRAERRAADGPGAPGARRPDPSRFIGRAEHTKTDYDTSSIPSASTGFIALSDKGESGGREGLTELVEVHGFELIEWDGKAERAIVDHDGRIIAVLAGHPDDAAWPSVHQEAHAELQQSRERCNFTKKMSSHRRGDFPALSAGISLGGGQKVLHLYSSRPSHPLTHPSTSTRAQAPGNLVHNSRNAAELARLVKHNSFQRIAGFASQAFRAWAPKLYNYYEEIFEKLLSAHPHLKRNFENSVWASAAFNFGPRTHTKKHRDFANLPFGLCSITSLGDFNHKRGGHLILWDLKLVIEFPSGSTVLIPSAAISHSNTPVGPRETRCSFTQYSAGGLFRWVAHGYQKDREYYKGKTEEDMYIIAVENEARRQLGLSLLSTPDEARSYWKEASKCK